MPKVVDHRGHTVPISDEARERFIELIRDGKSRYEAAGEVGETSTRFKGLIRRDPDFRTLYLEALVGSGKEDDAIMEEVAIQEKIQLVERLYDEYVERALDPTKGRSGSSNRALQNLLTLMHSTFKPFLESRTRHVHEGAVGVYAMPQIDTDKWTLEQQEEFVSLRRRMNELLSIARPDGAQGFPELEAGAGIVDDAEFTEVA